MADQPPMLSSVGLVLKTVKRPPLLPTLSKALSNTTGFFFSRCGLLSSSGIPSSDSHTSNPFLDRPRPTHAPSADAFQAPQTTAPFFPFRRGPETPTPSFRRSITFLTACLEDDHPIRFPPSSTQPNGFFQSQTSTDPPLRPPPDFSPSFNPPFVLLLVLPMQVLLDPEKQTHPPIYQGVS